MTKKRFNRVGGYVYDKDKCISHFDDVKHRDEIIDLLNELHEENEQLKFDLKYWQTLAQSLAKKNNVGDFE